MFEIIFDILKELLKLPSVQRLVVVLFLPNVLVWGFNEIGIDNKYNFLWTHFVGPYWTLEVFIFKVALYGIVATTVYSSAMFAFKIWREIQTHEVDIKLHDTSYKSSDNVFLQRPNFIPEKVLPKSNPEPISIPEPKQITPEEIKRRALRDITGRGA